MRRLFLLVIAIAPALLAADPLFERAWNKLDTIESGRARPGSVIEFTPGEWNAWAQVRVPQLVEGVRNPHIELGTNTAAGSALVDFVKMRESEGIGTNPVLARLIDGERPVRVLVRVDSGGGRCTVHCGNIDRIDIHPAGVRVTIKK